MKKVLLIVALTMISTGAFAQTSFNVKAGMNVSNWMGKDVEDLSAKIGFKVGVGMEYQFTDLISLQPSLMFSTKGGRQVEKYDEGGYSGKVKLVMNQAYLELPIMVAFRLNIADNTNIVLSAGPYLAVGIGGQTEMKLTGDITWEDLGVDKDDTKGDTFGDDGLGLRRFDAGLGIGAAVEFGRMFAGLDCQFGMVKLEEDFKATNVCFGISVGYKF